jgi:hypothetical protein
MHCRVCGREFNPRGFQVVVPGLGMGFDRVECALEASATGVPLIESPPPLPVAAARPALALPAVAVAGAATLPVARAASERPPMLVGANLALLAAGTAATIYLWMRVFSPDAAFQPAPAEYAAAAFARSTVSAEIDLASGPTARPQPEVVVFDNEPGARGAANPGPETVAVSNPARRTTRTSGEFTEEKPASSKGGGSSGPVVRPTPPPAPPPPPPEEPPAPPPRQTPTPAPPVPTSPPGDRVPGAPLPGPGLPDSGPTGPGGGGRPGS